MRGCAAPAWGTGRRQQQDKENDRDHTTTTTPIEGFLARLDCVRHRGDRQWISRCPGHADSSPSLSIRECTDGTVLVHCFAGCSVTDVVSATGLWLIDLFPPRDSSGQPTVAHQFDARQVLHCLAAEALMVRLYAQDAIDGTLTQADLNRLFLAENRIAEGLSYVG